PPLPPPPFPYTTLFRSDAPPGVEAPPQRPGGAQPPRHQPLPRRAPALHPRPLLSLRVRAARRPERRLVEADAARRVAAAALRGRDRKSTRLNSSHQIIS